jgi:hypothetical protein
MVQELIARSRTQEQEIEHYRKMEVHTRADILEALRELLQRSERMVSWLTWFLVGIPDFKPGDLGDDMREWKKISDGVENILNPPQPPTPDDMPF